MKDAIESHVWVVPCACGPDTRSQRSPPMLHAPRSSFQMGNMGRRSRQCQSFKGIAVSATHSQNVAHIITLGWAMAVLVAARSLSSELTDSPKMLISAADSAIFATRCWTRLAALPSSKQQLGLINDRPDK